MIKEILFKHCSIEQLKRFAKKYRKTGIFCVKIIPFYGNLNIIARVFGTDKNNGHSYTRHYMRHFKKFRFKKIKLLEIGVGGYDDPHKGGESLGMWKKYFPFGRIFALDIYDKQALQESRIKIYQGSQVDPDVLSRITDENGTFDLIIDDGSHINNHIIGTFELLFPKLKDGGIYVIEDMQTSYWKEFGGCNTDFNNPNTAVNFCKKLVDCLNYSEFNIDNYKPSYYDLHITEIHFYHNLVFIYKNKNTEKSNMLHSNSKGKEK